MKIRHKQLSKIKMLLIFVIDGWLETCKEQVRCLIQLKLLIFQKTLQFNFIKLNK